MKKKNKRNDNDNNVFYQKARKFRQASCTAGTHTDTDRQTDRQTEKLTFHGQTKGTRRQLKVPNTVSENLTAKP